MKDEIKEILESLDKIAKGSYYPEDLLYYENCKQLLDYLTNLQEENDILKRDIEAMKHNYNLLVRLIENGESMSQKFENGLTYQDYKSRNEKAIEYIEKNRDYWEEWHYDGADIDIEKNINDIENILKGGIMNKEEQIIKIMNNDEIRDVCLRKDYEIYLKNKEIEKLNNIINELEKYLFSQLQEYGGGGIVQEYYDKLKELKEGDSND